MKRYLIEKLSDINFRIATHEGIALERLSSEANKILLLPESHIPNKYKADFNVLLQKIEEAVKGIEGRTPSRIKGINSNKNAIHYIKLLIDIEDYLTSDEN